MAYEFEVRGWEDWGGDIHEGPPDVDPDMVAGSFVFYWDDDTEDAGFKWVYTDEEIDSWDDWYDFIVDFLETEYGLEMA